MSVGIGIIGVGKWARTVHIPNVLAAEGAQVKALCSRSDENRSAGAQLCSEPPLLFERAEELLACEDVDAVIVCTPNDLHAGMAAKALRAGKHVLCEKPLALTDGQAADVVEAANRSARVLAVSLELRSSDVAVAAADAVREGRIGSPLMITGSFWRGWGAMTHGWRGDAERSGGVYAELFCHTADLQSCLIGHAPRVVQAIAGMDRPECTAALFHYPGGAVGVGLICLHAVGAPNEHPFEIVGDEGRLVGAVVEGGLHLHRRDAEGPIDLSPERSPGVEIHGFPGSLEVIREFVDCIEGRRDAPRAGLGEGLAAMRTARAVETAVTEGRIGQLA